jgi:general secretion pathway protein D
MVEPHINSSGLVKLKVTQEISSVSDKTVQGVTSPVFTKRKIETSLVVQDGHTVIFGGLIQNQHNTNESGVPGLKNLPFLGSLFRWRGSSRERKELLVAITPRVVRNLKEAEEVMRDYQERIEQLRKQLSEEFRDFNFIRQNAEESP